MADEDEVFDVIVIGAGPVGVTVAARAVRGGLTVARGSRVRSFLCYLVPLVLARPKHGYFVPVDGATACRLIP
jgi:hypothetical protein